MISLLLHKSKAKPRMSVNNKEIIQMYLLAYYQNDSTNQCFFCDQQAMASGYVHLYIQASFVINYFIPLIFYIYLSS